MSQKLANRPSSLLIIARNCLVCGTEFEVRGRRCIEKYGKYCSSKCYGVAKKNYRPTPAQLGGLEAGRGWNKGLPGLADEKHWAWKGDDCSYISLHKWIAKKLGKPTVCAYCGEEKTGRMIQWANISGEYLRVLSDWLRLCARCHWHFDREPEFKAKVLQKCQS